VLSEYLPRPTEFHLWRSVAAGGAGNGSHGGRTRTRTLDPLIKRKSGILICDECCRAISTDAGQHV
jgi:hypothetical protein